MSLMSSLFGSGSRQEQVPKYSSEQQQVLNQILAQAMGGMQNPTKGFGPIEEQARMGFRQKTLPSILERFAGMGQNRMSSGLMGSLGEAGTGLETNLAAMKSQYGLQNQGNLQNLLGMGLTQQFDTIYKPKSPGILGGMMGGLGQGLGGALGGGMLKELPSLLKLLFRHRGGANA